ncbi:tenascin-r [Plakobranchus ocellatus]|uniref:Tenascin-r n=1 Tax=Plakobranchus ocellatus TaxID=259542 RepID=A0AAV3ZT69_9GAST|nr:tenascin-r [Plakobranchus ocellatus]
MKQQFTLFVVLNTGFLLTVCALEMTRDLEHKTVSAGKSTCGVVRCLEQGEHPSVGEITSMVMSRRRTDVSGAGDVRIASVSKDLRSVSRLWNNVKIEGTWEKGKAEIKLYLMEDEECYHTDFSCRVKFLDGLGKERVNTGQVSGAKISRSRLPAEVLVHENMTGTTALQLSAVIQQSQSSLENALRQLQSRVDDSARALENRLEDKLEELGEAITNLKDNFPYGINNGPVSSGISATVLTAQLKNITLSLGAIDQNVDQLQESQNILMQNSLSLKTRLSSFQTLFEERIVDLVQNSRNNSDKMEEAVKAAVISAQMSIIDRLDGKESRGTSSCDRKSLKKPSVSAYAIVTPEDNSGPYLCDTMTDGGGWIVIQRRKTGTVDFYRKWDEYKSGFGSLHDDFWLGNERIHELTSQGPYELMVTLTYKRRTKHARYDSFSLGDEKSHYKLNLGSYSGTAGDSLNVHRGMPFTTMDKDFDQNGSGNCAKHYLGAWWYKSCHTSNLNGKWNAEGNKGPRWSGFTSTHPVSFSEMKIRLSG